jgi:hypothetical protein
MYASIILLAYTVCMNMVYCTIQSRTTIKQKEIKRAQTVETPPTPSLYPDHIR